jgi:hypothetical protein
MGPSAAKTGTAAGMVNKRMHMMIEETNPERFTDMPPVQDKYRALFP